MKADEADLDLVVDVPLEELPEAEPPAADLEPGPGPSPKGGPPKPVRETPELRVARLYLETEEMWDRIEEAREVALNAILSME